MGCSSCVPECPGGVCSSSFRQSPAHRFYLSLRPPSYLITGKQVSTGRSSIGWTELWRVPQWLCLDRLASLVLVRAEKWQQHETEELLVLDNPKYLIKINVPVFFVLEKKYIAGFVVRQNMYVVWQRRDSSTSSFVNLFPSQKLFSTNQCGNGRNHALFTLASHCYGWIHRISPSKSTELLQKLIFLGYLAADVLLASAFIIAVLVACPYCARSTPGSEDPATQNPSGVWEKGELKDFINVTEETRL